MENRHLSRFLSLVLVLGYAAVTGMVAGPVSALKIFAGMLLPLACIWLPDVVGEYTGPDPERSLVRPSPASFVWFLGWLILLLPLILGIMLWFEGVPLANWL